MATGNKTKDINDDLRITNYELQITNYKLRITNYEESLFCSLWRCPKSLKIIFTSLHFAKVLIARRTTTFGKVDCSDYQ